MSFFRRFLINRLFTLRLLSNLLGHVVFILSLILNPLCIVFFVLLKLLLILVKRTSVSFASS
ncbi:MAG: hypothetical protein CMJ17_01250 [Phenylobacterium sp.]|nr:hypothetical protein [Phenylobacterium sp.]